MDEKERNRILEKFMELIPHPECPMCHNRSFSVIDSYISVPVSDDYLKLYPLLKRAIPSVAVICTKCGFLSIHSMSVMGLMENEKEENVHKE